MQAHQFQHSATCLLQKRTVNKYYYLAFTTLLATYNQNCSILPYIDTVGQCFRLRSCNQIHDF